MRSGDRHALFALLLVSLTVRLWLIVQGGQYYWPDEQRYRIAQNAAEAIVDGDGTAVLTVLQNAEHILFKIVALVPALVEQLIGANSRIPAFFFALFSVAGIWAVWLVARRLGLTGTEALLAAFLLACSSTWFYYSRHLLPYDVSLTFGLFALLVALRTPATARDSWMCGLLSSASFLSYAGHWSLAVFVMLTRVLWPANRALSAMALRAGHVAAGFAAPILALIAIAALAGADLLAAFMSFSRSVTQGDFSEGWSLPFEFFWHAEHGLAIVWILAVAGGLHGAVTRRNRSNVPLAAVLFIYGTLVIASVGFEIFVVYGRTARQLVPFLSLIAAEQLYRAARTVPRMNRTIRVAAALILVQTLVNWRTPFSQIFPAEFRDRARTIAAAQGSERIDFLFVEHIYPVPALKLREEMTPILRTPHPLEFLPYQYEGYSPRDRAVLRAADISMRAVASR